MADIVVSILENLSIGSGPNKSLRSESISDGVVFDASGTFNNFPYINKNISDNTSVSSVAASGVYTDTIRASGVIPLLTDPSGWRNREDIIEEYDESSLVRVSASGTIPLQQTPSGVVFGSESSFMFSDRITNDGNLTILSPKNKTVTHRDDVVFSVIGVDTKDNSSIPNSLIRWYSSIDGIIKNGNNFTYNRLSVGSHVITVSASGFLNRDSSTLTVLENSKPDRPENTGEV